MRTRQELEQALIDVCIGQLETEQSEYQKGLLAGQKLELERAIADRCAEIAIGCSFPGM